MKSCLYECKVMHHRLTPKPHRFTYRIFMFYLDLDEVGEVARCIPFFSRNRFNLFSFHDADHLGEGEGGIMPKLRAYLASAGISLPEGGAAHLLTLPRVLGYVFNPVSFYICTDGGGAPVCAIAEVGNTFGEKKLYPIPQRSADGRFRLTTAKHFYVSPFSAPDMDFDFRIAVPGERIEIHVDTLDGSKKALLSTMAGRRAPLTPGRLAWFAVKYPLMTLRVILLIHWNALLLWLKGVSFHRKEAHPELQRDVIHPHPSIIP